MSAPNFNTRHNARHLYAFCIWDDHDAYVEETKKEYDEDEVTPADYSDWYDEEKRYYLNWLEEELTAKFGRALDFGADVSNVFDGSEVCTVGRCFKFAGQEIGFLLGVYFQAGYYCGFALDWDLKDVESYDCLADLECCADILRDERWTGTRYAPRGLNAGLSKALAPKFRARLEKEIKALGDDISDVLEKIAPHKWEGVVASNGEGFYFDAA